MGYSMDGLMVVVGLGMDRLFGGWVRGWIGGRMGG